jgi:hypothetical protein
MAFYLRVHTLPSCRRVYRMTGPIIPSEGWHAVTEAIAPYVVQPEVGWIMLFSVLISGLLRLLMEWQLRCTLTEVLQRAPGGSVIIVRKRGGSVMWIQVGSRPTPSSGIRPRRTELT